MRVVAGFCTLTTYNFLRFLFTQGVPGCFKTDTCELEAGILIFIYIFGINCFCFFSTLLDGDPNAIWLRSQRPELQPGNVFGHRMIWRCTPTLVSILYEVLYCTKVTAHGSWHNIFFSAVS